jgi:hypothetical protein
VPTLDEIDSAFYDWDGRVVHCTVEGDAKTGNDLSKILPALDRARDRAEVFELLVHRPGSSMGWEDFETLLAAVDERGLAWVTYEDMAHGITPVAGISLQYDGKWTESWMESRAYLRRHGARATIFVTAYGQMTPDQRAHLRVLHEDGHDLEAHSVLHLRAPVYVEEHGLTAYLDNEVQPSIDQLRADGYEVVSYAYPFGDRTDELDEAIARRVPLVRSLSLSRSLVTSPCPY